MRRSRSELEFRKDLASLTQLHRARWGGNSLWLSPAVESALQRGGDQLIASGAARLWVVEGDTGIVGATLFASAGWESCSLLTAYDRAWGAYGPGIAALLAGIEDAFMRGERSVELGYGLFQYQSRLADSSRPVAWIRVFPRGRAYALARIAWAPRHAQERLHRLRARLSARRLCTQAWAMPGGQSRPG